LGQWEPKKNKKVNQREFQIWSEYVMGAHSQPVWDNWDYNTAREQLYCAPYCMSAMSSRDVLERGCKRDQHPQTYCMKLPKERKTECPASDVSGPPDQPVSDSIDLTMLSDIDDDDDDDDAAEALPTCAAREALQEELRLEKVKSQEMEDLMALMTRTALESAAQTVQRSDELNTMSHMNATLLETKKDLEMQVANQAVNMKHDQQRYKENLERAAQTNHSITQTNHDLTDRLAAETALLAIQTALLATETAEHASLQSSVVCVICKVEPKNVVLMPCNHTCYCRGCYNTLKLHPHLFKCGLCRKPIGNKLVYFP
jgi:hypothetical protein